MLPASSIQVRPYSYTFVWVCMSKKNKLFTFFPSKSPSVLFSISISLFSPSSNVSLRGITHMIRFRQSTMGAFRRLPFIWYFDRVSVTQSRWIGHGLDSRCCNDRTQLDIYLTGASVLTNKSTTQFIMRKRTPTVSNWMFKLLEGGTR